MSDSFAPPSGPPATPPPPSLASTLAGPPDANDSTGVFIDRAAIAAIRDGAPLPAPASNTHASIVERRCKRHWPWVLAAGAVAIGAGVIAWRATNDTDEAIVEPPAAPVDLSTLNPALPAHLIFDEPPAGFTPSFAANAHDVGIGPLARPGNRPPGPEIFIAAPTASLTDGAWLAVTTESVPVGAHDQFDPAEQFDFLESENIRVGDLAGVFVDLSEIVDDSEQLQLTFGLLNGYAVNVVGVGLDRDQLIEVAEGITLEAGELTVAATNSTREFEPRADDPMWIESNVLNPTLLQPAELAYFAYTNNDDSEITIVTRLADPATFADRWAFAFGTSRAVQVGDQRALIGESNVGGGSLATIIVWNENGREVMVHFGEESELPEAQMLAAASSIRPATDEEWDDATFDFPEAPVDVENFGFEQAWLIGVGELEDSTTWVAELGVAGNESLTLSISHLEGNGTSSSQTPIPSEPNVYFESPDGSTWLLVATARVDIDGAVLTYTADDGAEVTLPLKAIAETGFNGVAVAVEGDVVSGRLVDSGGNELVMSSSEDAPSGGWAEFEPASTAPAVPTES